MTYVVGSRVLKAFQVAKAMCVRKQETLEALEEAMGAELVMKVTKESEALEETQYRPQVIDSPSRMEILKKIREEEASESQMPFGGCQLPFGSMPDLHASRSVRLSRSVGINMGLDLEMRQ